MLNKSHFSPVPGIEPGPLGAEQVARSSWQMDVAVGVEVEVERERMREKVVGLSIILDVSCFAR
jgi:hypothetical protein